MARVFLASASEDRPAMRRLAEALRRAGHEPWSEVELLEVLAMEEVGTGLDARVGGAEWRDMMKRVLDHSDALVVGCSAATERSGLRWHYLDLFWTATAAGKPAYVACLDRVWLPRDLVGVYAFESPARFLGARCRAAARRLGPAYGGLRRSGGRAGVVDTPPPPRSSGPGDR